MSPKNAKLAALLYDNSIKYRIIIIIAYLKIKCDRLEVM